MTPNELVMVIARRINLNVSCKLHPYSFREDTVGHLQGHVFSGGLEMHIRIIIMISRARI